MNLKNEKQKWIFRKIIFKKQIRFKTSILQSNLCDESDAYIAVKGTVTFADSNNANY